MSKRSERAIQYYGTKDTRLATPAEPLTTALDVVERLLLGQVASARQVVEARVKSAVRLTPEERRRVRAIGSGLRFAGDMLNELLDRSRGQ